jgi:hypothetical protein
MPIPKMTEAEFIAAWGRLGNAAQIADEFGLDVRNIQRRRQRLVAQGHNLPTRAAPGSEFRVPAEYRDDGWTFPREEALDVRQGSVVVFSDAHYWPGEPTKAHQALLSVIRDIKPRAVIANGDVFDGVSVSRHDPFGWTAKPNVKQELEACQERLHEIELAVPKGCDLLWNIGNHDLRFERTLAAKAPEFVGLMMLRLADHFPAWDMRWSTKINDTVMVKHRYASGIHAAYNNTMKGGLTIVTGHTHLLEVKPWGDYNGRRYGVQTGTLADHHGPQFEYTENSPSSACSGFAVLTFKDGVLMPPELCEVVGGNAYYRGEAL